MARLCFQNPTCLHWNSHTEAWQVFQHSYLRLTPSTIDLLVYKICPQSQRSLHVRLNLYQSLFYFWNSFKSRIFLSNFTIQSEEYTQMNDMMNLKSSKAKRHWTSFLAIEEARWNKLYFILGEIALSAPYYWSPGNSKEFISSLIAKLCLTLATPWTVACQAPLSMGFSRQEYWSGLQLPSPGDLPNPGIKPRSSVLQEDYLLTEL